MFDLKTLLPMAKPALEKEGLKSIVVRLHDGEGSESGIEIAKYSKDIIEHVQQQSAYIKQCESNLEALANNAGTDAILINGIKEIIASRKNSENKLKAIEKLLSE